jgi:hypothetical protein
LDRYVAGWGDYFLRYTLGTWIMAKYGRMTTLVKAKELIVFAQEGKFIEATGRFYAETRRCRRISNRRVCSFEYRAACR